MSYSHVYIKEEYKSNMLDYLYQEIIFLTYSLEILASNKQLLCEEGISLCLMQIYLS